MTNQQGKKVQNPETSVPKNEQMSERDFINDMLTTEKYMTNAYSTAMNELSCQNLYQDLLSIFNETQDSQRNMYNLMFKNGWYSIEAADQQKMQQSYQQFSGYMNQLPTLN